MKCRKCGQFCAGKTSSPESVVCDRCAQAKINEGAERRAIKDRMKSVQCSRCGEFFVSRKAIAWSVTKQPLCGSCKEVNA